MRGGRRRGRKGERKIGGEGNGRKRREVDAERKGEGGEKGTD